MCLKKKTKQTKNLKYFSAVYLIQPVHVSGWCQTQWWNKAQIFKLICLHNDDSYSTKRSKTHGMRVVLADNSAACPLCSERLSLYDNTGMTPSGKQLKGIVQHFGIHPFALVSGENCLYVGLPAEDNPDN